MGLVWFYLIVLGIRFFVWVDVDFVFCLVCSDLLCWLLFGCYLFAVAFVWSVVV